MSGPPQCVLGIVVACFAGSFMGGAIGAFLGGPMSLAQGVGQSVGCVCAVLAAMRGQREQVNVRRVFVASTGAFVGTMVSYAFFDDTLDLVTFVSAMLCATWTVASILMCDPNQPFTRIITEDMYRDDDKVKPRKPEPLTTQSDADEVV